MNEETRDFIDQDVEIAEPLFTDGQKDSRSQTEGGKKKRKGRKKSELRIISDRFVKNPNDRNFREMWQRYEAGLKRYAYKFLHTKPEASDAVLRTFELVHEKLPMFDTEKGQFSTWIYRVCRNVCLVKLMTMKKKNNMVDNDISDIFETTLHDHADEDAVYDSQDMNLFRRNDEGQLEMSCKEKALEDLFDASINEMGNLPDPRMGICLREKYVNGLKIDEITEKYGFKSVKNLLVKGKIMMKNILLEKHKDLYDSYYYKD